jgi:hypothetical protein
VDTKTCHIWIKMLKHLCFCRQMLGQYLSYDTFPGLKMPGHQRTPTVPVQDQDPDNEVKRKKDVRKDSPFLGTRRGRPKQM